MPSGLVIDLCTPPPSPQRTSSGGGGCIDLCTPPSSPTAHGAPAAAAPAAAAPAAAAPAAAAPAGSKRPLSTAALSTAPVKVQRPEAGPSSSADAGPSPMEDEEVLETAAPPAANKDVQMGGGADENEDVQCTGRTGDNALMDFPHARENCVAVKFVQGQVPHPSPCADAASAATWLGLGLGLGLGLELWLGLGFTPLFTLHPQPAPPAGVQVLRELLLLRLRCAGQGMSRVGRQPLQSVAPLCGVAAAAQAVEVAAGRRRRRQGRRRSRRPAARDGRGSVAAPSQARGEGVELRRLLPSAVAGPRPCTASLRPCAPAPLHLSASPPLRRGRCTRRRSRSLPACCRRSHCAPTRSRASPS